MKGKILRKFSRFNGYIKKRSTGRNVALSLIFLIGITVFQAVNGQVQTDGAMMFAENASTLPVESAESISEILNVNVTPQRIKTLTTILLNTIFSLATAVFLLLSITYFFRNLFKTKNTARRFRYLPVLILLLAMVENVLISSACLKGAGSAASFSPFVSTCVTAKWIVLIFCLFLLIIGMTGQLIKRFSDSGLEKAKEEIYKSADSTFRS